MKPKHGYNQKLYDENYDGIDWSKTRKQNVNNESNSKGIKKEEKK